MKQPDLGLKIIELRQNKGLTQEELVKQCNLSVRTLQRIESGEVVPRGYTIRLISKALGFDLFDLAQIDSDHNSEVNKSLALDDIDNLNKVRNILIQRYAIISNSSVDKIKSKLEISPIEEIMEKHNKMITLSIVLVSVVVFALIIQFIALYHSKNVSFALITNVGMLIVFQRGMHLNYEIKHILKTLKEIG